jgi:ribonuclease HI
MSIEVFIDVDYQISFVIGGDGFCHYIRNRNASPVEAILRGIKYALGLPFSDRTTIFVPSLFRTETFTVWADTWRENGWRNKNGEPVKYADLIQECTKLMSNRTVLFAKIK